MVQAHHHAPRASGAAGDLVVTAVERSFDIKPHPIQQRQDRSQPFGINPGRVQADGKPEVADLPHGFWQHRMARRFAAAKDHAIQETAAGFQPG